MKVQSLALAALVTLALPVAHASTATDIPKLTNAQLEALVPALTALQANPTLGNCAPKVARVKVADLGADEVIENAINGYVSDLETAQGLQYDFGLLSPSQTDAASIANALGALAADNADAGTKSAVADLAKQITPLVAPGKLELLNGSAVYRKVVNNISTQEADLTLRLLVDKANGEFLLFGAGACSTPSGQ